jgi:hypothetical protein
VVRCGQKSGQKGVGEPKRGMSPIPGQEEIKRKEKDKGVRLVLGIR